MYYVISRMISWISACVTLSVWVYAFVTTSDCKRLSYPADAGSLGGITNHVISTRRSRSVHGIAPAIVKAFMKGTREVPSKSPVYRKFLKQGSEFDAVTDFNSLNSDVVERMGYGAVSTMGDIKVKLKLRDGKNSKLPTVQIWDPNMEKSVKIIYINKPIL